MLGLFLGLPSINQALLIKRLRAKKEVEPEEGNINHVEQDKETGADES